MNAKLNIVKNRMTGWAIFGITIGYAAVAALSIHNPLFIPLGIILFFILIVLS